MVVSSCNLLEDNVYDLGEDEIFIFEEEDTIIYSSVIAGYDSFQIHSKTEYYETIDENEYQEETIYYKSLINENESHFFRHKKSVFQIEWCNLSFRRNIKSLEILNSHNDFLPDETIYSFEGEETADSLVKTIWFTHKYGIVRYEYNNGEVYELVLE